ncbi:MAG: hypothetical protein LBH44_02335 [Treponema sp.]|nr:hypothetical protein [Treponema sp.]
MKKIIYCAMILIMCALLPCCEDDEVDYENRRITVKNNEFMVEGKRIWINGTNTPWDKWNDFGGGYNDNWWNEHFAKLHKAGINAVRVWINCNNDNGAIDIGSNGMVSGVSAAHWNDLDLFFKTAERNKIYIMATLLSFDHFKNTGSRPAADRWRAMLKSDAAAKSFVDNYTVPFVKRYKDNPWLWSIDICNEPDWIFEENECGKIQWERISYFLALNAAAIHEHSKILVTVGMSFPKYNADGSGYEGNKVSDAFLQSLYKNNKAYLDFWSPHYYDWVGVWYSVPFYVSPYGSKPAGFGLDGSKPAIIGECSAKGSKGNTITSDYKNAHKNGWQGVMPWTSNGVDGNGSLNDMLPAVKYMLEQHRDIIFPLD